MLKRLRLKFVAVMTVIFSVMLFILFCVIFGFTRNNLIQQVETFVDSVSERPFSLKDPGRLEDVEIVQMPYFVVKVGTFGEISTRSNGDFDLSDEEYLNAVILACMEDNHSAGMLSDYNLYYGRSVTPTGQNLVFADVSGIMTTLHGLADTFLFIGAFSLLIFIVIGYFLARWAVRPVASAWNEQRQFVADASHELKTPLTVIMTNAEMMQSDEYDEETKNRFADSILIMSKQMRNLVEELLELARADINRNKSVLSVFNYSEVIENALLPFDALFFENELTLESQIDENIFIFGSEDHLRQILEIFLDNAQKYASKPGFVKVTLKKTGRTHCRLSVSDTGEPISAQNLKNIFRRFYRVDEARSRDGSFGLGLSIAQAFTQQHNGKIWAESKNGWNTFTVELPLHSEKKVSGSTEEFKHQSV